MIQVVKDGGIEQFEKAMPQHHWQRNKKQSVNYVHDSPFATDRQLEDQRLLMQKNRNPQFLVPTKVDKVRSQVISSTVGASRAVAVKANVLNKIVREASGVHNYTIVAPLRTHNEKQKAEILEPETNPRVRPYAQEAKLKPVLVSFGHRPRSASRTFHPATMKFRLKHGEIARGGDNIHKTGFGLPVTVLKQILKAPKIYRPGEGDFLFGAGLNPDESLQDQSEAEFDDVAEPAEGYDNLFFSEEEHRKMFKPLKQPASRKASSSAPTPSTHRPSNTTPHIDADNARSFLSQYDDSSSVGKASWVSSVEKDQRSPHKPPLLAYPPLEPLERADGRPAWDEAHHCVRLSANHLFQMRASGLTTGSKALSLGDRLKRFAALSVAETQPVLFCTEKQETDKKILAGIEHSVPKPVSHLGKPVYMDPNNNELKIIKHNRGLDLREERRRQQAKEYQQLLSTIPKVDYFPTSRLVEMRSKSSINMSTQGVSSGMGSVDQEDSMHHSLDVKGGNNISTASGNKFTNSMSSWSKYDTSVLENTEEWENTERNMRNAMKAARAGDVRALYEHNMRSKNVATLPALDTGGHESIV